MTDIKACPKCKSYSGTITFGFPSGGDVQIKCGACGFRADHGSSIVMAVAHWNAAEPPTPMNAAIRRELRTLLGNHFQAHFPDFEGNQQLDKHIDEVLALLQPLPEHIAARWRDVFGLIVCRNRSKSDQEKVQAFWLAMNKLTGLSKADLPEAPPPPDTGWILAAERKPPHALAPNGQVCNSGWSKWVIATNITDRMDDVGAPVFAAAWSYDLDWWHDTDNRQIQVTHWRDDITAPTGASSRRSSV